MLDVFNQEAFAVMDATYGGVSRQELLSMPFPEYEEYVRQTAEMREKHGRSDRI